MRRTTPQYHRHAAGTCGKCRKIHAACSCITNIFCNVFVQQKTLAVQYITLCIHYVTMETSHKFTRGIPLCSFCLLWSHFRLETLLPWPDITALVLAYRSLPASADLKLLYFDNIECIVHLVN